MALTNLKRLLVANRGEIACRVMNSARALGLDTVAVHSEADARAKHVKFADAAVQVGSGSAATTSYLDADAVLAAARAEDQRARAQLERVPLLDLLRRCIDEIRETHALPERAVALESDDDAQVRGSAGELMVVFRNLLENAVKYSDAPVEVRVLVRGLVDGRVAVEIRDRGVGIPSDELRKIFQRFYRAGRDVQRKASGLGLGLFIVRNLVRRQGGRVVARSDGFGQGSRFVVTLRAC